jgi:hypothetical protein
MQVAQAGLAATVFCGSGLGAELGERIGEFSRDSVTAGLRALRGG